jgi:L-iditol 2-dehydrogenase
MRGLAKLAPGAGSVALVDRGEVASPAPGHVVVDVTAAGVCGTDLHIADGEFPCTPPVTMGHEVTGVVAALGDGVDPSWSGARVVCETYFSTCDRCAWCRDGRINLCPQRRSIGSHVDGGFAPSLVVPARNLHRVPAAVGEHAAALTEPLACVCHSLCDPSRVTPGDDVLVVGPGTVGLLAAQVARAGGGNVRVVGTAADEVRLAAAAELGFETEVQVAGAGRRAAAGADVVVECSGSASGAARCLTSVRPGGRYVQIGLFGKPVTFELDVVCYREVTVSSGFASTPASWRRALRLLADRTVLLDPLVTEVAALDDFQRVFDATRHSRGIKFVFDPRR